jgi:PAS domain-containing protein
VFFRLLVQDDQLLIFVCITLLLFETSIVLLDLSRMSKRQTKPILPLHADNHSTPMLLIDSECKLFDCNLAASTFFNIIKKRIQENVLGDFLEMPYKSIDWISKTEGTHFGIFKHLNNQAMFHVFGYPLTNKSGYYVLELAPENINESADSFESQKNPESIAQRLSVATQAAALGIWEYNPITLENVWDNRMFEIFGIGEDTEISFTKFKSWIHPDDWPTVKSNLLATKVVPINFIYRIIRQNDKSLRYVQAFGTRHGNSNSLIGVNIDVTEKIEIENQLRQTANRLSLATKSAKIGVWDWDLNTNAIRWDPMMFELYGWDEKSGRESFERFNECIYPDDRAMVASLTSEVIAKKSSVDSSFRIVRQSDKSVRYMKSFGDLDVVRNMYRRQHRCHRFN